MRVPHETINGPDQGPHNGTPRDRGFWRLWSTEPKLLVGLAALIGAAATVVGLFIHSAQGNSAAPPPSATTTVAAPGSPSSTETPTSTSLETDPLSDGTSAVTEGSAPVIQAIRLEAGDYHRVGPGLYQLGGARTLEIRYWWTTITNYGSIDSNDTSCAVVATITDAKTGAIVDTARSATCSLSGWQSSYVPQGSYRLSVSVTLESGAKGSAKRPFTVTP
jgi:hypothetical protein